MFRLREEIGAKNFLLPPPAKLFFDILIVVLERFRHRSQAPPITSRSVSMPKQASRIEFGCVAVRTATPGEMTLSLHNFPGVSISSARRLTESEPQAPSK